MKRQTSFAIAAVASIGLAMAGGSAIAESDKTAADINARIGVLTCNVEGGWGLLVTSSKDMACTFAPRSDDLPGAVYTGEIAKLGIDIGKTEDAVMKWGVVAANATPDVVGLLEGTYAGVSANASAGTGGGANVLVGGLDESITLQPISVQAQTGVNLALGVTQLELKTAR